MPQSVLTVVVLLTVLLVLAALTWVRLTNQRWERIVADVRDAAEQEARRSQATAQDEIARAQAGAVRATEAAVRSVSSTLVGMAAKTSRKVSEGVRTHQDDDAFETLVGIDHTVQQMLLVGQGWTVLAGGKLTRHWPATTLTDVVRSAMGYVEGYDRVRSHELDIAVRTRVVGPVVHTLAILLDNALSFSPPQSRVHVSFEQGHHGVIVIIDDSGLQMTPEQLDAARDILTGQRADDITQFGARPQTGFRVAAALAAAYGFRVDVQAPNSLLGTRALLVLPQELLTMLPQQSAESAAPPHPVAGGGHPGRPTPDGTRPLLTSVRTEPDGDVVPAAGAAAGTTGPAPAAPRAPEPVAPVGDADGGIAESLEPAAPVTAELPAAPLPRTPAPVPDTAAEDGAIERTASGLAVRRRRSVNSAPAPAPRPVNAAPGRASVVASWARGTERARAELAGDPTADADAGTTRSGPAGAGSSGAGFRPARTHPLAPMTSGTSDAVSPTDQGHDT